MSLPKGFKADIEDITTAIELAQDGLERLYTKAKLNDLGEPVLRRIENKWRAQKTQRRDVESIVTLAESQDG